LLLDYGFPVEATNASGTTALMDACQQGSLKICELLHEYGASLKCQLSGSPLHQACSMGNLEIVEWLLDNDIDPCTMYGGRSAFVDACSSGNTDLVALLYSRGFTDISVCSTDDGMNGLHWACRLGNKDLCRFLVDKNIDLDARNKAVESALSIALHACDDNIIHIIEEKTLLVYGENKKFTSDLINEFYRCLKANNFPVASYILRLFTKRIPLDTLFPGNLTLLHFAAAVGEEDTIQLLVSNNLNPGSCTNRGRAPLHYAASGGHLPAAKLLVSLGADPSIKDDLGRTCEDFARMRRDTEFVDWMASITTKSTFSSFFGNFACVADTASPEATKIGSDSQNDGVMLADSDEILYILWSEIEELDRAVQSTVHHS
jgi:ankyrin repeat protein